MAIEIFGQGLSQVSHADHADIDDVTGIENLADEIDEDLHVISLFGIAREADQHQIAAYLHGCNTVYTRQDVGKDMGNSLFMAGEQGAAIFTESLDRLFGNIHVAVN